MMTTMDLNHFVIFQAVAEAQSFTAAAKRAGLDKSRVSRVIGALEASLQTVLFVRTTRSVRLTPEGIALSQRVGPLIAGLQAVVKAVPDRLALPSGEVVLATTADIGRALLGPHLARFRARFPAVRVRVLVSERVVDFAEHGLDLALRVGTPGPGSLSAHRVMDLEAGFFASSSYLESRGHPQALEDLGRHEGLWSAPPKGHTSFSPRSLGRAPSPAAVDCSDFALLAAVARAGGGVALLPTFLAREDVDSGKLVRVLPRTSLGSAPLFLVSRATRTLPPRVASLRTFLLEAFKSRA